MNKKTLIGEELEKKLTELSQVKVDSYNWIVYYIDENTNEKWKKTYAESEYHGGGTPTLIEIERFPWE